jgi:hypothetical protein
MELTKNEKRLLEAADKNRPKTYLKLSLFAACLGSLGGLGFGVNSFLEQPRSLQGVAIGVFLIVYFLFQYAYFRLMNDSSSLIQKLKNKIG